MGVLRIATRGSALARWQAGYVADLLGVASELVIVSTTGDRRRDVPIHTLGGQGVFVKEVQSAVLEGRADLSVHSAKDLPSGASEGLKLAAVPERGDPRDALVGSSITALAPGARVATGSVRRRCQLLARRPDLVIEDLRGNIETRLAQVGRFDAVVVAVAALDRLNRSDEISEALDPEVMLPQVAQGALAVECRASDSEMAERLGMIDHRPSHRAVLAERAFLSHFDGGCDLPVGAWARIGPDPGRVVESHAAGSDESGDALVMDGLLAHPDGKVVIRRRLSGADPEALGGALFRLITQAPHYEELLAQSRPAHP